MPTYINLKPAATANTPKVQSGYINLKPGAGTSTSGGLKTTGGLEATALKAGVSQTQINRVTEMGEQPDKIYSGGFVSDIFDTLNALQYGVAGMIKGKSFMEGVQTRESFTKQDALGKYGIPGLVAGIALDIAVDPLTWISPLSVLRKIPGAVKLTEGASKVLKESKVGQFLGEKLIYMFGQDPLYKESYEKFLRKKGISDSIISDLVKPFESMSEETQRLVAEARQAGKLESLPPKVLEEMRPIYTKLDELSQRAVKLGLLDEKTYNETVGKYMTRAYRAYDLPQAGVKGLFPASKFTIDWGIFKKREDLPADVREAYGEILEAGYPTAKSMFKLSDAIEKTEFFNAVAKNFSSIAEKEGFKQLPAAGKRVFTTSQGQKIQMYTKLKSLNTELRPALKALNHTFAADKDMVRKIANLEKDLDELGKLREDEFFKFFSGPQPKTGVAPAKRTLGTVPQRMQILVERVKQFPTFAEFQKSAIGAEAYKLHVNGDLQRAGIKDLKDLWQRAKSPYGFTPAKITQGILPKGDAGKLVAIQRQIENLIEKIGTLKGIDQRSIQDSLRYLEEVANSIRMEKEGVKQVIGDLRLAELAGKYVPAPIFNHIMETIQSNPTSAGDIAMGAFKFGKVILNPATHARNILSNLLLNGFEGLMPYRIDIYTEAAREMTAHGKWWTEARNIGLGVDNFASREIYDLLEGTSLFQKAGKKLTDLYQGEEQFAKLAQYIFQRKAGKTMQEALEIAERATFNYAQVTPFIRRLRTAIWGYPFITFGYKAAPQIAKTAVTHPGRISYIGKIKNAIEGQSDIKELTRERATEPDWVKNGFYVRMPVKDKQGRSMYLDLSYIVPFGDLISGQWMERGTERETQLPETMGRSVLRKIPFLNMIGEIWQNTDFYGNRIVNKSDPPYKQAADISVYLMRTIAPPLAGDLLPGGYEEQTGLRRTSTPSRIMELEKKGIAGVEGASLQTTRTPAQETLRNLGLKISPTTAEGQEAVAEWRKKTALEALLKEKGAIKSMEILYKPKKNR